MAEARRGVPGFAQHQRGVLNVHRFAGARGGFGDVV